MNKGRWASIRLVARRFWSAVDVSVILVSLALERNHSTQSTSPSEAGLLAEGTVRQIARQAFSREDFDQRQPKPSGTPGRKTYGQVKYKSQLALRPVELPRTPRDYSGGPPEIER